MIYTKRKTPIDWRKYYIKSYEIDGLYSPQCSYGCGNIATTQLGNGNWCCSDTQNSCPVIIENCSKSKIGMGRLYRGTFLSQLPRPKVRGLSLN